MIRSDYGQLPQHPSKPINTRTKLGGICKAGNTEILNQSLGRLDCSTPTQPCPFGGLEGAISDEHFEEENARTRAKKASRPNIKLEKFDLNSNVWPSEPVPGAEQQEEQHPRVGSSEDHFVTAIYFLSRLLNIDIQARLLESPCRCLASTAQVPPARCTTYTGDENKPQVVAALDTVSELKITTEKVSFAEKLDEFIDLTFCGKYHSWRARQTLRLWMWLDVDFEFRRAVPTPRTKDMLSIQENMALQRDMRFEKAKTTEAVPNSNISNTTTNIPDIHSVSSLASCHNSYPVTVRTRNITSPARTYIRRTSKKHLTPTALKTGYLYVYRLVGLPGERQLYKIGYTCVGVRQRIRRWEEQCGHKAEIIYPSTISEGRAIKHVQRLEQLVHMDLKIYQRHERNCWKCSGRRDGKKRSHREWFRTCEYRIKAVIMKWRAWIEQRPYKDINGVWQLEERCERQLDGLCTPAQDLCNCSSC